MYQMWLEGFYFLNCSVKGDTVVHETVLSSRILELFCRDPFTQVHHGLDWWSCSRVSMLACTF